MKNLCLCLTALLATSTGLFTALASGRDAAPLPVKVSAGDLRIQSIGRFDTKSADAPRFAWAGSRIVARFEGTAINAEVSGQPTLYLNVLIDEQQVAVLQLAEGRHIYELAKGLSAGVHTLELFERTEASFGTGQLHGFQLPAGGRLLLPPPRAGRRIEIIGDSIACGYGNERINALDTVEFAPGQGVGALEADWVVMERNILSNNCYTTIYATSGISTLGASNFDSASGIYKMLIRDNVSQGNETKYIWTSVNHYSDGNGIILDVNISPDDRKGINYLGRTLVQNNLVYDNGGAGIHCVSSAHIDIIGNTFYQNSRSPHLEYDAIDATWNSNDVRIINNIMVARVADVKAGEKPEPLNTTTTTNTNIVFRNNIYFGGNVPPTLGEGDQVGDPLFILPSVDPKIANFRLLPGSPAIAAGVSEPFGAFLDLAGQLRATPPSIGAYEISQKN